MRKLVWATLLIIIVTCNIALVANVHAAGSASGILNSNTTWTKANSPYTLSGPVAVDKGVTLTIEPGVTVNLNNYYIQVNGTLIARGTDNEKIYFSSGYVALTSVSQQTGQASVLENTVMDILGVSVTMTITKNFFKALELSSGSSTVSYNTIESLDVGDSSTVANNEITESCKIHGASKVISNNINARVVVSGGTPTISNNKISDGIHCDANGAQITVSGNEIHTLNSYARIFVAGSHADITNNVIIGQANNKPIGITVGGYLSSATITGNQIYNCKTGITVDQSNVQISKNVVAGCDVGISLALHAPIPGASAPYNVTPIVDLTANTISKNAIGIEYLPFDVKSTISNNNINDNSQYNLKLVQYEKDIAIPNNWWGTTDSSTISQKIFDFQADFNLGHVITNPILTAPASGAPALPKNIPADTPQPTQEPIATPNPTEPASTPTSQPTKNPSQTPNQPNSGTQIDLKTIELAILVVLVIIAVLLAALIVTLRHRR